MRYTLRITDHNYNVVLELHYDYYSTVCETAAQMIRGATQDHSMDILIIDNATQREIWSDATTVL